jgi:hypothetical protein
MSNGTSLSCGIIVILYPIVNFQCCGEYFDRSMKGLENLLVTHFKNFHPNDEYLFKCTKCPYENKKYRGLTGHYGSHDKSVSCDSFDSFTLPQDIFAKITGDTSNKTIEYPVDFTCCNMSFNDKTKSKEKAIQEHFKDQHDKTVNYSCSVCNKLFDSLRGVSLHFSKCSERHNKNEDEANVIRKEEINEKRNDVKPNEKNFQSNRLLIVPYPIDFICPCGEKFAKNKKNKEILLAEHLKNAKIHENSKYCFQCTKCNHPFNNYSDVHEHYLKCKTVTAESMTIVNCDLQREMFAKRDYEIYNIFYPIDFTCNINTCGTAFGRNRKHKKEAVIKHFQEEHATVTCNFKCSKCNYECSIYDDVEQHYQLIHSVNEKKANESEKIDVKSNNKEKLNEKNSLVASNEKKNEMRDNLIKYFSDYDSSLVGSLDSLFMKFAAIKGPECEECVKLNKYLSSALDMPITKLKDIDELRKRAELIEKQNKEAYLQKFKAWIGMKDATEKFVNKNK